MPIHIINLKAHMEAQKLDAFLHLSTHCLSIKI